MMRMFAFGVGVAGGVQAWRNFPRDGPISVNTLIVVISFALVCAFLGGLWLNKGNTATATATASATASAKSEVNQIFVMPGGQIVSETSGVRIPAENAQWIGPPNENNALDTALDALSFEELTTETDFEPLA